MVVEAFRHGNETFVLILQDLNIGQGNGYCMRIVVGPFIA